MSRGSEQIQPHTASKIKSFDKSLFCKRLDTLAKATEQTSLLRQLCTATASLLDAAEAISRQVIRFLPQFTLHDEAHLWNVLGFMEELAGGQAGIENLGAGDCAMAVWAAFVHDLGMVLDAGELAALDAADHFDTTTPAADASAALPDHVQGWREYRDGHEHWREIRQNPDSPVNRMRLGLIRAAFIRDSHARVEQRTGHCRIADWLTALAQDSPNLNHVLQEFALEKRLVCVAVSHNQEIDWLPRQLKHLGTSNPDADFLGPTLGTVHWTWIGWLLRLADVFDCDKSRTPKILFDHSGITDQRSQTEWQKHLAIKEPPTWNSRPDGHTLLYTCHFSPNPRVEKALHQIVDWMNDEIKKVRAAANAVPTEARSYSLQLPSQAELDIKARKDSYQYHDMQFQLDRDAVIELLMGESLYGGPELALRELVQNALDAVHLRDQRNRLAIALRSRQSPERLRQPHQSWDGDTGMVHVTWGEKNGRRFIEVRDNGVGMTVGTMKRFLTQIGKSYYKSDDFLAEQEQMRRNGILCTAISQFGIGFLSVFMLADEVTIYTRPVGAVDHPPAPDNSTEQETARFPFRAEIHGPHGLLTFYPDRTITEPGTTVVLWLKNQFRFVPWDRELLLSQLRREFYKIDVKHFRRTSLDKIGIRLDPAFEIARYIVWPLSPVLLAPYGRATTPVVLSDVFHARELVPFDDHKYRQKAAEWDVSLPEELSIGWQACDWVDEHATTQGMSGTGSRIRLIAPQTDGEMERPVAPADWTNVPDRLPGGLPTLLLGSFAEPQLPAPQTRYQCLVNGVRIVPGFVPGLNQRDCKLSLLLEHLPVFPGEGGWAWIDLRGSAMPRLRADRSAPVVTQPEDSQLSEVMQRWLAVWPKNVPTWVSTVITNQALRQSFPPSSTHVNPLAAAGITPVLQARLVLSQLRLQQAINRNFPKNQRALIFRDRDLARVLADDHVVGRDHLLSNARARALNRARNLSVAVHIDLDLDLAVTFAIRPEQVFHRDRDLALTLTLARDLAITCDLDLARELTLDFDRAREHAKARSLLLANGVSTHLAAECLWPKFSESHPALGVMHLTGTIREQRLCGPVNICESVTFHEHPAWLAPYDLIFPYTCFPLEHLRAKAPDWDSKRHWRRLFVLPLLFGQEPSKKWRERLDEWRPFARLMLFLPNPDHWEWLFEDHTPQEWAAGSASALWDLETGEVVYADGIHTEASLKEHGKPLREWLKLPD